MEWIDSLVAPIARWLELAGVAVIVVGGLLSAWYFAVDLLGGATRKEAYHGLRANVGRAILLGLELLVAGDIIATILVEPSLETEIEGVVPWRRRDAPGLSGQGRGSGP